MREKFAVALLLLFIAIPVITYADITTPGEYAGEFTVDSVLRIVGWAAQWFFGLAMGIGVIMIIAAGVVWMTAAGNADRIGTARKMLIWGLIGIAVALLAWTAQGFIENILGQEVG